MTKKASAKSTVWGCQNFRLSKISEMDAAAESEGLNRAEWIELAIDKMLGKRPRRTLLSRLAKVEQQVRELMGERSCLTKRVSYFSSTGSLR